MGFPPIRESLIEIVGPQSSPVSAAVDCLAPPPTNEAAARAYDERVRDEPPPALHEAARTGSATEVEALLGAGAAVTAATDWGDTALHWAAIGGHVNVSQRLLDAGADVGATCLFDQYGSDGWQPLHWASLGGNAVLRSHPLGSWKVLEPDSCWSNGRLQPQWLAQPRNAWPERLEPCTRAAPLLTVVLITLDQIPV